MHCSDPESGIETSWSTSCQPGGVVLDQAGEPVVASPEGLSVRDRGSCRTTLRVPIEHDRPENRANDVKVDDQGRAWVGTMAFDKRPGNAALYASLTVHVNNPRWAGVPLTLRSGKALETDSAKIAM